jgi:hypothetical protein
MRSETYPLAMPEDLMAEVRRTAQATGLSPADAMLQAMIPALAELRDAFERAKPSVRELARQEQH